MFGLLQPNKEKNRKKTKANYGQNEYLFYRV